MLERLPPPTSFAEGQRALALWSMLAAGVFAGVVLLAFIALFVWGGWSKAHERLILLILAGGFGGFIVAFLTVIIASAVGGPVGRFKVSASKESINLEADGDQEVTINK